MPSGRFRKDPNMRKNGHKFTEENTYYNPSLSHVKVCRTCTEQARTKWKKDNPEYWIAHQKKRHGLSEEKYNEILLIQNFSCAICKNPFIAGEPPRIDHDHLCCESAYSCGKCVRGLLCISCNWGLGSFKDSETNLANAAEYLVNPPNKEKQNGKDAERGNQETS